MKRNQWILLGILAVQILVSVIVFLPNQGAEASQEPLFAGVAAEEITTLTITDDTNATVELAKVDGAWVLPDAGNYPANQTTIAELVTNLLQVSKGTLVTNTDASHAQLKVADEDFLRRIIFSTSDGTVYVLYLGTAPRYTATYFRVQGDSKTYQTAAISTWQIPADVGNWADTAYVSIDQETLTEVMLKNPQGTFTFVKSGEEWLLDDLEEGELMTAGNASAIVRNASIVTLARPLGMESDPSYGLSLPTATVILRSADAEYEYMIGAMDPTDNTYAVKSSESPYYVRVAEYLVKSMVESSRDDFIQQPTPTPEAETEP